MGFRATAQNLNLNRDYLKADAPEMRAWLEMFDAWLPDLFIDMHTTNGADYQYDLTWYSKNGDPAPGRARVAGHRTEKARVSRDGSDAVICSRRIWNSTTIATSRKASAISVPARASRRATSRCAIAPALLSKRTC